MLGAARAAATRSRPVASARPATRAGPPTSATRTTSAIHPATETKLMLPGDTGRWPPGSPNSKDGTDGQERSDHMDSDLRRDGGCGSLGHDRDRDSSARE